VRLADGEILCSGLFESPYTTPLVEGGVLYVIDARAIALELPARAEKGMRPKERWKTQLDGAFMASPFYRDGLLYTIENQKCRLHVLDARTGEVLTVARLAAEPAGSEKTGARPRAAGLSPAKYVYASPVASDRHIYFFDDAGHATVLELGRQPLLIGVNDLEDACSGTPFFIDDEIIFRGAKTVYCLGAGR